MLSHTFYGGAKSLSDAQSQTVNEIRIIEDCVDYFNRHKDTESIYRNRANGDDLGHVEDTEEIEEDARPD